MEGLPDSSCSVLTFQNLKKTLICRSTSDPKGLGYGYPSQRVFGNLNGLDSSYLGVNVRSGITTLTKYGLLLPSNHGRVTACMYV